MRLGEKQRLFNKNLNLLGVFIYLNGYEMSQGRGRVSKQDNEAVGGHPKSCHLYGLAQDINLYKNEKYLRTTAAHKFAGEFWKSLNPLNRWGGDFTKPDGNHYSMTHNGVK